MVTCIVPKANQSLDIFIFMVFCGVCFIIRDMSPMVTCAAVLSWLFTDSQRALEKEFLSSPMVEAQ